jgi:ankyrin repeat protein
VVAASAGIALFRVYLHARLNAALLDAVHRNNVAQVEALLQHGADGDAMEHRHVNLLTVLQLMLTGRSAEPQRNGLDIAVSNPEPAGIRLPLEKESEGQWYRDNARIVELLMKHGAKARGYRPNGDLWSPFEFATARPLALRAMLANGVRVIEPSNPHGDGVLDCVGFDWLTNSDIEALIRAGANVNGPPLRPEWMPMPLEDAIFSKRLDRVRLLLRYGADPTLHTDSDTPIGTLQFMIQQEAKDRAFVRDAKAMLQEMNRIAAERAKQAKLRRETASSGAGQAGTTRR